MPNRTLIEEVVVGDVMTSETQPQPPAALERGPLGESAVLLLDAGMRERDLSELWPSLAQRMRVAWLSLSAVDDPLVHARALFERQLDAGRTSYLVTSLSLAETAMVVAAHRTDAVGAVLIATDETVQLDDELRELLVEQDVPVRTVEPGRSSAAGLSAERQRPDDLELIEDLVRELLDHHVRTEADKNRDGPGPGEGSALFDEQGAAHGPGAQGNAQAISARSPGG